MPATTATVTSPEAHDMVSIPVRRPESIDATPGTKANPRKMVLRSALASNSQRRRVMANTNALTKYEADLTDQDRAKQKEAVRRYLAERVKVDWEWPWPRPDEPRAPTPELPSANAEDPPSDAPEPHEEVWKERDEWLSNASEGETSAPSAAESRARSGSQATRDDRYRFGSPEEVGSAIRRNENERKRRHKKRVVEEMAWNEGVRCFVQRRDAWTGARRVPSSPNTVLTPTRTNRSSTYAPSSVVGSISAGSEGADSEMEWTTEIPIAPSILPPGNAMRASITPAAYNTIYDKVILQQLTPSCPMNLKDVTRSCVQGWKRDGEWPPKSIEVPKKKARQFEHHQPIQSGQG